MPEPILHIVLDRGYDAALDNPNPPITRGKDIAVRTVPIPAAGQLGSGKEYLEYWKTFYGIYISALTNPDARSVIIDGDSDSWELQRLAEFGRLVQVPPHMYAGINAARRAFYNRAWESGKVVLFTNKLKDSYEEKEVKGEVKRVKSGKEERQGFSDLEYLFQIQLRHLYDEEQAIWGVRIEMCKANTQLKGLELWGEECNFKSLVQNVYPQYSLQEWGYK